MTTNLNVEPDNDKTINSEEMSESGSNVEIDLETDSKTDSKGDTTITQENSSDTEIKSEDHQDNHSEKEASSFEITSTNSIAKPLKNNNEDDFPNFENSEAQKLDFAPFPAQIGTVTESTTMDDDFFSSVRKPENKPEKTPENTPESETENKQDTKTDDFSDFTTKNDEFTGWDAFPETKTSKTDGNDGEFGHNAGFDDGFAAFGESSTFQESSFPESSFPANNFPESSSNGGWAADFGAFTESSSVKTEVKPSISEVVPEKFDTVYKNIVDKTSSRLNSVKINSQINTGWLY